ncbi:hypothetical protein D3C80_1567950 [compost metagenome]
MAVRGQWVFPAGLRAEQAVSNRQNAHITGTAVFNGDAIRCLTVGQQWVDKRRANLHGRHVVNEAEGWQAKEHFPAHPTAAAVEVQVVLVAQDGDLNAHDAAFPALKQQGGIARIDGV